MSAALPLLLLRGVNTRALPHMRYAREASPKTAVRRCDSRQVTADATRYAIR